MSIKYLNKNKSYEKIIFYIKVQTMNCFKKLTYIKELFQN